MEPRIHKQLTHQNPANTLPGGYMQVLPCILEPFRSGYPRGVAAR